MEGFQSEQMPSLEYLTAPSPRNATSVQKVQTELAHCCSYLL
jgi:hypothetical protein